MKNKGVIWIFAVITAIFVITGLASVVQGIGYMSRDSADDTQYEEITATITDITSKKTSDDYSYTAYVTYEYDGRTYENIRLNFYSSDMYIGKEISLMCDTKHPDHVKGTGFMGNPGLLLAGFGGMFALVAVFILIVALAIHRKADFTTIRGLQKKGKRLTGRVDGVENYQNETGLCYVVLCSYMEQETNTLYKFRSAPVASDPSFQYYAGAPVTILVDPDDYSNYYVDLSAAGARVEDYSV